MELKDKVAIITGGSEGVGAATARALADRGAKLMLVARRPGPLEACAERLRPLTSVSTFPMDVGDPEACAQLFDETRSALGGFDILINNAGYHARGPFGEIDAERLATIIRVNLEAPIRLSRLALPHLIEAGGGAIINVGSLAGRTPVPGSATYGASKAGLRSFSHALADELAESGVQVGLVSPGPIDTGFIMDELHTVSNLTMSQPISTAAEVAEAIVQMLQRRRPIEISMPWSSGLLTMLAYAAPGLVRPFRPLMERKGARVKARILEKQS